MSTVIDLAQKLIAQPSITPDDAGCQKILADYLKKMDFKIEHLKFADVDNLYARRGDQNPLFLFAGHTDVVPPGPLDQWFTPPFQPSLRDGYLYGRGASDMKGGLAAMVIACKNFVEKHPNHSGSIAFLITSDEEGVAIHGTQKVLSQLLQRNETFTWCVVGEASCENKLGDTIKIGRRGSLNGHLKIQGKQGHIAYPKEAANPIHLASPALQELIAMTWDSGNEFFPATSLQISNIHAGTGADNVIPGILEILFNFRYSPETNAEILQQKVENILNTHHLNYQLNWRHSGKPFLTNPGELVTAASQAINEITKQSPKLSTSGGTSDGRFIATTGCQVIEFGPCNKTIHQINENVKVQDLEELVKIYQRILELVLL